MSGIAHRILGWLRNLLGKATKYIKIWATDKYLHVKNGAARIVSKYQVPRKHRSQSKLSTGSVSQGFEGVEPSPRRRRDPRQPTRFTDEAMDSARISTLKGLNNEEVAHRAAKNPHIRTTVIQNPDLVGARTEAMADLKIKVMSGQDIQGEVESNPQLDWGSVKKGLNMSELVKLGHNQMGDQIADLFSGDTDPGVSDGSDTSVTADTGAETSGASSEAGPVSALDGSPLSGVDSISINTGSAGGETGIGGDGAANIGTGTATGVGGGGSGGESAGLGGNGGAGIGGGDAL